MGDKNSIRISVELQGEKLTALAAILESVFPVKFDFALQCDASYAGAIVAAGPSLPAPPDNSAKTCQMILPRPLAGDSSKSVSEIRVRFSDDARVPFPFRGRPLSCKVGGRPEPLKLIAGEKALLTCERGVLWTQSEVRGVTVFRSALSLPEIPAQGNLHDVLNGDRFLELLPVLHFLRTVTGHYQWQRPPVRAQFMFDDPNLHWPTYGLVNYAEVAARAARENYHVSFATVPLDGWYTNQRAAELFRNNPARLSLCIHGNDHTKRELAQTLSATERVTLLRQALRRAEKLEQGAGVPVSRVMVPPHGACSHEMLQDMPGCGFESACISHGSLRSHNRQQAWTASLGYQPVSHIAGCPVLPRWGFVGTTENTILLAAFLDQALVLRGHHQDLKDGIELMDEFARLINGLGPVNWTNMADISRQCFFSSSNNGTVRVRPWVNRIALARPSAEMNFVVEEAQGVAPGPWRVWTANGKQLQIKPGESFALPAGPEGTVVLDKVPNAPSSEAGNNPIPIVAFVRRLLTEGRDRIQGVLGGK